jgi:hypothetical protein
VAKGSICWENDRFLIIRFDKLDLKSSCVLLENSGIVNWTATLEVIRRKLSRSKSESEMLGELCHYEPDSAD